MRSLIKASSVIAAGVISAGLAGCGSSAPATVTGASSTSGGATPASAPPVVPVDVGTAGRVCAGLNAMTNRLTGTYTGADAIATVAQAFSLTQAQVVYAIVHRCPQLKRIVPASMLNGSK